MAIIAFADSLEDVTAISTGLFIDKLTGIGGIPRGRILELFGKIRITGTPLADDCLITRALKELKERGVTLALLSSNSEENIYVFMISICSRHV